MTRKHKRHHKDDKDGDDSEDTNKSIKLVLKVGNQGTPVPSPGGSVPDENDTPDKRHKHKKRKKHKEKKEKKRREEEDSDADEDLSQNMDSVSRISDADESEDDAPPPLKAASNDPPPPGDPSSPSSTTTAATYADLTSATPPLPLPSPLPSRSLRERKSDGEKRVLNYLLDYLHKMLSRKDVNGFFQFPVTDQIAPRYSEIISNPMDFSTIRKKLDNSQYSNVSEFKYDFRLMLENCMAYNHPDTIFHKEAQRLLTIGLKQLSKEKLVSLKRSLPNVCDITDAELGLKDDGEEDPISCVEYKKPRKGQMKYEAIADDGSPEDILSQVQAAAQLAASNLREKNGNSKIGYLKRKEGGSTYLNILNPDNTGIVSETERVVNIGGLMEKLKTGTGNLAGFREDKRNKAIPLSYLTYGPFSSYAPIYDSTTANLSKEESDLLLSTYGDDMGMQYSKSIQNFVENSGDYAIQMVDNLLEILTAGRHTKTKHYFIQKDNLAAQKEEEEKRQKETAAAINTSTDSYDIESLKSLTQLGIDMSFLDTIADTVVQKEDGSTAVQEQLNQTSQLLQNLNKTQHQRLSSQPPPHLALVPGPSDKEVSIAEKLTQGLTGLAKQAHPSDVISVSALRSAMSVDPAKLLSSVGKTQQKSQDQSSTLEGSNGKLIMDVTPKLEAGTSDLDMMLGGTGSALQNLMASPLAPAALHVTSSLTAEMLAQESSSSSSSSASSLAAIQSGLPPIPTPIASALTTIPTTSAIDPISGDGSSFMDMVVSGSTVGSAPMFVDNRSSELFDLATAPSQQLQMVAAAEQQQVSFGSNGMDTSETEAAVAGILG